MSARKRQFYAIGESVYVPKATNEQIKNWNRLWWKDPLSAMLKCGGMLAGDAKTTLEDVMGIKHVHRVFNLLPPANKSGVWKRTWARECADELKCFMVLNEKPYGLYLLGTKVIDAFTQGDVTLEFGEVYHVNDIPCLAVPHPSGRGRWLNDADRAQSIRDAVSKFHESSLQL